MLRHGATTQSFAERPNVSRRLGEPVSELGDAESSHCEGSLFADSGSLQVYGISHAAHDAGTGGALETAVEVEIAGAASLKSQKTAATEPVSAAPSAKDHSSTSQR